MKKDKKAASQNPDMNEDALNKDYQQEEDEDVKEKHKITKVIIAIILAIAIFFVFLLIRHIKDESGEKFYDVDGVKGSYGQDNENSSKEKPVGCVLDLSGEYVTVTVPLKYYEDDQPSGKLTDELKVRGYTDVKKSGGNIVYTMKTSYYYSIVSGIYEGHHDDYRTDEFCKENDVLLFAQDEPMQKFTVTISERDFFSPADYYKLLEHNFNQAAIYQCYLGIAPADINVDFQFKYEGAQNTFVTYKFPELLGKNLSSVPVSTDELTKPHSHITREEAANK